MEHPALAGFSAAQVRKRQGDEELFERLPECAWNVQRAEPTAQSPDTGAELPDRSGCLYQ